MYDVLLIGLIKKQYTEYHLLDLIYTVLYIPFNNTIGRQTYITCCSFPRQSKSMSCVIFQNFQLQ